MLINKKELLEEVEEKYRPMLKLVSIPDFTKCVAQFSGLHISEVSDDAIKEYLVVWAKNKYRFFKMLGNKLRYDTKIVYKQESNNIRDEIQSLEKSFPAYSLWLRNFRYHQKNKINSSLIDYDAREMIDDIFPNIHLDGCSITHFFKEYLKASDKLVTALGRVWENSEVEVNYTLSIDPVDMMLASENPYSWDSCYRLEVGNDGLHGDGCLAAVLDNSSLITYVWSQEGDFSLYHNYNFKNVRYKRMRAWISISPSGNAIHFNTIYPGKNSYSNDFVKLWRITCENIVSNKETLWKQNEDYHTDCFRQYYYGYGEYFYENIYTTKDAAPERWEVFNEHIVCPCGCGNFLPQSDENGDLKYNGEGFIWENYYTRYWCEYADEYCDAEECDGCYHWNRTHAVCVLDTNESCDNYWIAEEDNCFDPDKNNIVCCGNHCDGCPLYKLHHRGEDPEAADKAHEEEMLKEKEE